MDISRGLKDIIYIIPFLLCGIIFSSVSIIIYLSLLLWAKFIFIYERILGDKNV